MIQTENTIINPVEFLKSDPSILNDFIGEKCISGSDITMQIRSKRSNIYPSLQEYQEISPILGSLYTCGEKVTEIEGKTLYITWHPSPEYINELATKLDLTPGLDVLKFENCDNGKINPYTYVGHLASGVFPQSIKDDWFLHDRTEGHAIGAFLIPSIVVRRIKENAKLINLSNKSNRQGYMIRRLTENFDSLTPKINRLSKIAINENELDFAAEVNDSLSAETNTYWTKYIFGIQQKHEKKDYVSKEMARIITAHLTDLIPRIDVLKLEKARSVHSQLV